MAYKDISRGVRLAADHAKYLIWLAKDTEARQVAYAAVTTAANKVKTTRVAGFIVPFDSTGTALAYVPARLISPTQTGRGDILAKAIEVIVNPFTFTETEVGALTTPNVLSTVKKFKFAKMTIIQRVKTAEAKESSRITGRKYFRHENDSITAHFGKKVAADTYDTVTTAIKANAAYKALFLGDAEKIASKARFVPEGV